MNEIVDERQTNRSSLGVIQMLSANDVSTVCAAPAHFVSEEDSAAIQ